MCRQGSAAPFWYGRVLAYALQLLTKGISCTVTPFTVKMPDATIEVCSSPCCLLINA